MAGARPLVVIGHKNPDTDSICSAIAYARYKSEIEGVPAIPYRAGNINSQTRHVLSAFATDIPELLPDVYPRIRDIMIGSEQLILSRPGDPIAGARRLMLDNRFSFLPVTDEEGRCVGKLTALRLAALLDEVAFAQGDDEVLVHVPTLAELAGPLGYITPDGGGEEPPEWASGMLHHAGRAGDREDAAILFGTARDVLSTDGATLALVAHNGEQDEALLAEWSSRTQTPVLTMGAGEAQAAAYLRIACPISTCIEDVGPTFRADDTLRDALREVNRSNEGGFIVLDSQDRITGVVTRVNFMTDARFTVALVDHNELSQSVDGMEFAHIAEIIDHHRIGSFSTSEPITFLNRTVGSTCTIVADLYRQAGATPSPQIAGLLLSGILSDTVILRSPTTDETDRATAEWLAPIAGVDVNEYGEAMFEAGSEMHKLSPREIVELDLKYYDEEGIQFSVSQVETTGFKAFWDRSEELCEEVGMHRKRAGLHLASLMVTDITHGTTLLVVSGEERIVRLIAYPEVADLVYEMTDVLSRKKQVLPYLMEILHSL